VTKFDRILFTISGFAATVFVVGFGFATAMYPGGNHFDRAEPGYDFADNYLCDTFRARAYDGRANEIGAEFGQIGMLGLVVAASAMLLAAPSTFRDTRPRLARTTQFVATLAFFGMLLVPLTPAHEYGTLHFAAVGVAAIPSLLASYLAAMGVVRVASDDEMHGRLVRMMSLVTLAACTLHFGQYLAQIAGVLGESPWVPRTQKVVVSIVLGWIGAMIVWARHRDQDRDRISGERLSMPSEPEPDDAATASER